MGIASSLTTATQARAILDDVTITLTVNHLVTGGTRRNIMIHDSKLILVQEGTAEPRAVSYTHLTLPTTPYV